MAKIASTGFWGFGDVAVLANDLHIDLTVVAQQNLDKLADRAARGKIKGEGDER